MIYISLGNYSYHELVKIISNHPFAEIRLDLLALTDEEIAKIFSLSPHLIVTYRPGNATDCHRIEKLKLAIQSGAAMVDIELNSSPDYITTLKNFAFNHNCKTIISFHDFNATPSQSDLLTILKQCQAHQPDIIKIVTYCQTETDAERLLELYQFTHLPLVAFGMGPGGKYSRVTAMQKGAPFIFAALDKNHLTAPDQLTVEEVQKFLPEINPLYSKE